MNKLFKYVILKELKLILEYYQGDILVNDFIDLTKKQLKDVDYNPAYNCIIDIRESNLIITESDMEKYIEFAQGNELPQHKHKTALITNTPSQVVTSIFYTSLYDDLIVKYEIFSTLEGALEWLKLSDENVLLLEENINKLKDS